MTPISKKTHMRTLMMTRMMRFVEKLRSSEKPVLRQMIRLTMNDAQSVTGRNLRGIMLLTSKSRVKYLTIEDVRNIKYHDLDDTEKWRIVTINEVLEIKSGDRELPVNLSRRDLEDLLNLACTS